MQGTKRLQRAWEEADETGRMELEVAAREVDALLEWECELPQSTRAPLSSRRMGIELVRSRIGNVLEESKTELLTTPTDPREFEIGIEHAERVLDAALSSSVPWTSARR